MQCSLNALHSAAEGGTSPAVPHAAIATAVVVVPHAWVVSIGQGFPCKAAARHGLSHQHDLVALQWRHPDKCHLHSWYTTCQQSYDGYAR